MSNNTIIDPGKEKEVETKAEEKLDEYEQSAQYLQVLFTQFRRYGYALAKRKKNAPIRVLESLLFHGLHDVELIGEEENELLDLSRQVMYHKNKLMQYVLKRAKDKEKENEQE